MFNSESAYLHSGCLHLWVLVPCELVSHADAHFQKRKIAIESNFLCSSAFSLMLPICFAFVESTRTQRIKKSRCILSLWQWWISPFPPPFNDLERKLPLPPTFLASCIARRQRKAPGLPWMRTCAMVVFQGCRKNVTCFHSESEFFISHVRADTSWCLCFVTLECLAHLCMSLAMDHRTGYAIPFNNFRK